MIMIYGHLHWQSSFGRRIHLTLHPAPVMIESDLNRRLRSVEQLRPIHPPPAMHAKQNTIITVLLKVIYCLAIPIA